MSPLLLILIPLLSAVAVAFAPRGVAFRVATISTLVTLAVSLIIASDFGHWYDDGFGLVTDCRGCHQSVHLLTCMPMPPPCGWCCFRRS